MDQAAIGHLRQRIGPKIRTRFPGVPVEQVVVLQYGDDPVVGPGDCHLRVVFSADGGEDEREQVLQDFSRAFRCELRKFWDELASSVPEAACLELRFGTGEDAPRIVLDRQSRPAAMRGLTGSRSDPGHGEPAGRRTWRRWTP